MYICLKIRSLHIFLFEKCNVINPHCMDFFIVDVLGNKLENDAPPEAQD